jgi:choline-sulfatase
MQDLPNEGHKSLTLAEDASQTDSTTPKLSRRAFIQGTGAALLGAAAANLIGLDDTAASAQHAEQAPSQLPERPNIVIILTDQEREECHWPANWSAINLPNRERLVQTGLSFKQAYCNSCMCSPSRSTFFSGLYPAQHGVTATLTTGGSLSPHETQLSNTIQNMARVLESAGYNVHYRGKWHLSKGKNDQALSSEDVAAYGFNGWIAPDAGEDTAVDNFGGGEANHDGRFAKEAADFIASQRNATRPFALIVSFVNPHDVLALPRTIDQDAVYNADPTKYEQGIKLEDIPSLDENLLLNKKPHAQRQMLAYLNYGLGILKPAPAKDRENYINLYAYLQKVSDAHIGTVIDALEDNNLRNSTIVIRTADHGEMGLSHGGMRQKLFNAYQETIHIPLVISNPILFPTAKSTTSLASLIDIMPTLASIAKVPQPDAWDFKGVDLSPILSDPSKQVQDAVLFTFDDENPGSPEPQTFVTQPNHIRTIVDGKWKFSRYFDPSGKEAEEYELYDLVNDPNEMNNLAGVNTEKQAEMAAKLAALEAQRLAPSQIFKTYLPSVQQS